VNFIVLLVAVVDVFFCERVKSSWYKYPLQARMQPARAEVREKKCDRVLGMEAGFSRAKGKIHTEGTYETLL